MSDPQGQQHRHGAATEVSPAYLVMAHNDAPMLGRLCERLISTGDVVVHLDRRAVAAGFAPSMPAGVHRASMEVAVQWGAWSVVEAVGALLRTSLETTNASRLVLLSGTSYPILPDARLLTRLAVDGDRITAFRAPDSTRGKPASRFRRRFHPSDDPDGMRAQLMKIAGVIGPKLDFERAIAPWSLHSGSMWWSVTRTTAEVFVRALDDATDRVRYFRRVTCADESFFPTVYANVIGLEHQVAETPMFARWSGGRHPRQLTADDIDEARDSGRFLYARKLTMASPSDRALLDWIDETTR